MIQTDSTKVQEKIVSFRNVKNDGLILNATCEVMVENNIEKVEELLSHLNPKDGLQRIQAVRMLHAIGGLTDTDILHSKLKETAKEMNISFALNKEKNGLFTQILKDKQNYAKRFPKNVFA